MSQNSFSDSLNALSTMTGVPHSDFTFIFASAPLYSQVSGELEKGISNVLIPIGAATQFVLQDGRQSTNTKVLGTNEQIPLPGVGSPQMGTIQSLLIFSDMPDEFQNNRVGTSATDKAKWHLLKRMYAYMIINHPDLVSFFYKSPGTGEELGLVPVAYNDTDQWRNFSRSTLYDFPVGLYYISRSQVGNTLSASFLEGVRLQGGQNFAVAAVSNAPMFETVSFTYVKNEPVDPSTIVKVGSGTGTGGYGEFMSAVKSYLGY